MDENAVRKFSVNARIKLRKSVESSMARLGVGPGHEPESIDSSGTTTILNLPGGLRTMLDVNEADWRMRLMEQVSKEGYDNVVERVAYTWFNRIIAIRYMEVNDFLPTHVCVLSSVDEGKIEPDIVTQCIHVADAFGLSSTQKEEIIALKEGNQPDRLFSRMFIHECNSLSKILPELFTRTESYERLLLDLSYTVKDGVIRELVDTVPEEDFRDAVQIIGWMYQYYNTELKDQIFDKKKNAKISKEQIPAATQLFTPDWIVRYMVENSLGRVWLEGHPDDSLQSKWRYYLEEAEQEPKVAEELEKLRAPRKRMEPVDIKIIDPCMGSGHILVYAFDVLIQIYDSYGYSRQDAAQLIIENNLFGLDIDERAYQLAYFAVMMKARSYDPNIFMKDPKPNLHAMVETSGMDVSRLGAFGNCMDPMERSLALSDMRYLFDLFREARTYGSLIRVRELDFGRISAFLKARPIDLYTGDDAFGEVVAIARILSQKYDAVITNPPYMAASGMDQVLSRYVKDAYPESKSDLFACFIERCLDMIGKASYASMITMHAFMFLSSFEKMRQELVDNRNIVNLVHQGAHGFDQIGGEVVQTVAFTISNDFCQNYVGIYCRLIDDVGESAKESRFLSSENRFYVKQSQFNAIPGSPIAYWIPVELAEAFKGPLLMSSYFSGGRNKTHNNDKYVRFWWEVADYGRWKSYCKGGPIRRWYGNVINVVDWSEEAKAEYDRHGGLYNQKFVNKAGITWTLISSSQTTFRIKEPQCHYDSASPVIFNSNYVVDNAILGYLNSNAVSVLLSILNPTINMGVTYVLSLPDVNVHGNSQMDHSVTTCIDLSRKEWNSHEISRNYLSNKFEVRCEESLESNISRWILEKNSWIHEIIENEMIINRIIDNVFGIDTEGIIKNQNLEPPSQMDAIKQLISLFVGVMFGRFSLNDVEECSGVNLVGLSVNNPDILILSDDDLNAEDDIISRFIGFISELFGKEHLEQNLRYIANNLDIKYTGTSRDGIRKYFLNNFYDDHVTMYQKCPIYWLFDSGKENGFKALIYMHRYTPDLISKMRQDYLLPMMSRYRGWLESAEGTERIELQKKIEEIRVYDIAMERYASEKVSIDLDDGVKVNYAKFQNIENPGSKKRIDLLHPLK